MSDIGSVTGAATGASSDPPLESPAARAERLPVEFFRRVWAPPHDLDAIDALMTEDYAITTGGVTIRGENPAGGPSGVAAR